MNRRQFTKSSALSAAGLVVGSASTKGGEKDRPKIKIGQIGVGHAHASGKMQVYRQLPDLYEVVGIVEPDDELWKKASTSKVYQGLRRMSLDELMEVEGLQAVAVETKVADLLGYAETCVNAGLHIHLDKPAGDSFEHYKRIMKVADEKRVTVQMGYMYRYNPAILLLQQFLENGWLGDVFEVHTVMSKVIGAGTRKELAQFKGGTMFELGCHIIDLVVSVLGKPDKVTPHIRHHGDDGLADNMLAVFDYEKATATVRSSALEVEGFTRRHLTVCGTRGTFHIQPLDRPTARIALDREIQHGGKTYKKGVNEVPFDPPYRRYVGDAIDLARIINGEKESDYPSSHDLAVQETVLLASGMPTT